MDYLQEELEPLILLPYMKEQGVDVFPPRQELVSLSRRGRVKVFLDILLAEDEAVMEIFCNALIEKGCKEIYDKITGNLKKKI